MGDTTTDGALRPSRHRDGQPRDGVTAYGYLGVTAPDPDAWRAFAHTVLGASVATGPGGTLRLRLDERVWRIEVREGPGGLDFCGWEVADPEGLAAVAARLTAAGWAVEADQSLAEERGVRRLLRTTDPGGNRIELFCGAPVARDPFVSPTGARFVTGVEGPGDLGFGHTVLTVPDRAEALRFYVDVLGFRITDWIDSTLTSTLSTFLHVNQRHHSLALVEVAGEPSALNHIMLQVDDVDMVGRALDAAVATGLRGASSLGRHANDWMLSFYVPSPSGFNIEYGTGARLVDDRTWTSSVYSRGSLWGHVRPHPRVEP